MGRDDLRPVAPVDLVAVVLGRVVARGDHHPRRRAPLEDCEGADRGRHRVGEDEGRDAVGGQHTSHVLREDVAHPPRVAAHDHAAGARVEGLPKQIAREPRRGLPHHRAVHAVGAGADDAPQARGAELESARERVLQLGRGFGIRVVPGPGFGLREQVVEAHAVRARAASRPAAASTSSTVFGTRVRFSGGPAARTTTSSSIRTPPKSRKRSARSKSIRPR